MLKIPAHEIVTYMKCPKRAEFTRGFVRRPNPLVDAITIVVQKAHLHYARYGSVPSWSNVRHMITWQIQNDLPHLLESRKNIENMVSRMEKWYSNYFLDQYALPGISNVPLLLSLGHSTTLTDKAPLVLFSNQIELVDFIEVSDSLEYRKYNTKKMRDDFELQLRLWIWWKTSTILPAKHSRIVIGQESLRMETMNVERKVLEESVEPIVKHVVNGIQQRVYYRSKSEQCNSCPFFDVCQP